MDAVPRQSSPRPFDWRRCVQFGFAFLLGVALTALIGRHLAWHFGPRPTERERFVLLAAIDVNKATKADLQQLPGIGERLADDIIAARAERGRFDSFDDLQQVSGFGPGRAHTLQPYLRFDAGDAAVSKSEPAKVRKPPTRKISAGDPPVDVNRASAIELQSLPGIGPVLAQRIIVERQRKAFSAVDDLRRVSGIGPKTLEKLRPYIRCSSGGDVVADSR